MLQIDLSIVSVCYNNGKPGQESAGAIHAVSDQGAAGRVSYTVGHYFGPDVAQNAAELHTAIYGLSAIKREYRQSKIRLLTNCYFLVRATERKPNNEYKSSFSTKKALKTLVESFRSVLAGFPLLEIQYSKNALELDQAMKVLDDVMAIKLPVQSNITTDVPK